MNGLSIVEVYLNRLLASRQLQQAGLLGQDAKLKNVTLADLREGALHGFLLICRDSRRGFG
jgi:hypothetical protein